MRLRYGYVALGGQLHGVCFLSFPQPFGRECLLINEFCCHSRFLLRNGICDVRLFEILFAKRWIFPAIKPSHDGGRPYGHANGSASERLAQWSVDSRSEVDSQMRLSPKAGRLSKQRYSRHAVYVCNHPTTLQCCDCQHVAFRHLLNANPSFIVQTAPRTE